MIAKRLSLGLWLAAVFLLGTAAYLALRMNHEYQPAFLIEEPERDLDDLPIGSHTIVFRLTNSANKARRIIGLAEG
jgi:hypothetical protein